MTKQIQRKITTLAKKAAEFWNNLTDEQKEEYEEQGTSTVFEEVDDETYMTILNADDDEGTLFEALDEEFWDLVED